MAEEFEIDDDIQGHPIDTVQRWYRDRFGIHDHANEWPLNMTRRAHASCVKVWVEVQHPDGTSE